MKKIFENIKLLICDVDGVMTSGEIILSDLNHEIKAFHVHDGFGIQLLLQNNIEVAVISSRNTPSVNERMAKLGVKHVYQGIQEKLVAFESLLKKLQIKDQHVAYIGDDWPDLPVLNRVGMPIAVSNAVPEVQAQAKYITTCPGGRGAVREVVMKILAAQGHDKTLLAKYNK